MTEKPLKPLCSCGHPQSYPIPHEHDQTSRERVIIAHYEEQLSTRPNELEELDENILTEIFTSGDGLLDITGLALRLLASY